MLIEIMCFLPLFLFSQLIADFNLVFIRSRANEENECVSGLKGEAVFKWVQPVRF